MADSARLAVCLAEFNALRAEIINHTSTQNTLTTFTLAATGALGSFAFSSGQNHRLVLLLLVPLNAATGLLWLENARSIFKAGDYIQLKLWPKLRQLDRSPMSSWEDYLESLRYKRPIWEERSIFLVPFFILFLSPIIGALASTVTTVNTGFPWLFWALDVIIAIFMLTSWIVFVREFLPRRPKKAV